jgi:NodT family efflux transporter outer membrane factor (OMF) lipoprotein
MECFGLVPASAKLPRKDGGRLHGAMSPGYALVLLTALCMGAASCAVGPDYQSPPTPIPASFAASSEAKALRRAAEGSNQAVNLTGWWLALHDRELDSLIDRAIVASPTLQIALNRVQQARAQEAVFIGAALPQLEASEGGAFGSGADLARGRASQTLISGENAGGVSQISNLVGFDAAWELDVFGKFRREIESAQYDVEAAMAARNLVLVSLIADVTRAYLDMRALQMQLVVVRNNIAVANKYISFVQERFNRGITNELDVTLAQRELAQLQALVAPLIGQIRVAQYLIAELVGEYPENLAKELARPGTFPSLPARIQPGLPITLLRRRPDIQEAERQLASATAQIGVATADLFPQVAVTASGGWQQGVGLSAVPINPIWSLGPAAAAPLLDFGRLDAIVEKSDFHARELFFNYKQTVLNAVRDVDSAVVTYAAQQDRVRYLSEALVPAKKAVTLAEERFDRGLIDFLNVIDAQRQEYELETQLVVAQQGEADAFVLLYRSLGGGWENYQLIPPIPTPLPAIAAAVRSLLAPDTAP